jgi:uncharacterized protein YjaG (DUF416 family)
MGILRFDEQLLVKALERLPAPFRVVFAAACAERLLPAYTRFSRLTGRGDVATLKGLLECLWLDVQGERMHASQVQRNIDVSMSLIPQEDSAPWVAGQVLAEDAAAAVTYALRCRQNAQAQEAAWAARRAYELLDHSVIDQEDIDTNRVGAEERVLAHQLIQAELLRQRRDLDELLLADLQDVADVAQRMRQRAHTECETVFKPST